MDQESRQRSERRYLGGASQDMCHLQVSVNVRIHDTYVIEYTIRTDFSVQITRYDTQYVWIFPRKLHNTIHSIY